VDRGRGGWIEEGGEGGGWMEGRSWVLALTYARWGASGRAVRRPDEAHAGQSERESRRVRKLVDGGPKVGGWGGVG